MCAVAASGFAYADLVPAPQVKLEPGEIKLELRRGVDPLPKTVNTTVSNPGTATLRIERVSASCGCSQPRLEQRELEPGPIEWHVR